MKVTNISIFSDIQSSYASYVNGLTDFVDSNAKKGSQGKILFWMRIAG